MDTAVVFLVVRSWWWQELAQALVQILGQKGRE